MSDVSFEEMDDETFEKQFYSTAMVEASPETSEESADLEAEVDNPFADEDDINDSDSNIEEEQAQEAQAGPHEEETEGSDSEGAEEATENVALPEDFGDVSRLMQPFKAGGKEIQISSVDEAISLMQRGVGMSKNLARLKPFRRAGEMLERANLLKDEDKLAMLIEASTGDKAALSRLLTSLNVDPLDLTEEEGNTYKRKTFASTDETLDLKDRLAELQATEEGAQTLQAVRSMDTKSRDVVLSNPTVLDTINAHVANGVYQKVSEEVERRMLLGSSLPDGRSLDQIPFIEAYKYVGEDMLAQGKLGSPPDTADDNSESSTTNGKTNPGLETRKKAASPMGRKAPPRPKGNAKQPSWREISDDDFLEEMSKLGL